MTRDLKVLRDQWRTWIIILYSRFYHSVLREFEMQVLQMVRVVLRMLRVVEWLRYAICNIWSLDLAIRDLGKWNFYIPDPLIFPFVNRARYDNVTCPRIICANLLTTVGWITIRTWIISGNKTRRNLTCHGLTWWTTSWSQQKIVNCYVTLETVSPYAFKCNLQRR